MFVIILGHVYWPREVDRGYYPPQMTSDVDNDFERWIVDIIHLKWATWLVRFICLCDKIKSYYHYHIIIIL